MRWKQLLIIFLALLLLAPISIQVEGQSDTHGNLQVITPQNVGQLQPLATLGMGTIHDIALSGDGRLLAVATDNAMTLFDISTWAEIQVIEAAEITSLDFSNDGSQLVSGGDTARVWDVQSGTLLLELIHPTDESDVQAVAFSPDDTAVLTFSVDTFSAAPGTLHVWDVTSGEHITEHIIEPLGRWYRATGRIGFSSSGTFFSIGNLDEGLRIWRLFPYFAYLWELPDIAAVTFSTDEVTMALINHFENGVYIQATEGDSPVTYPEGLPDSGQARITASTFNHTDDMLIQSTRMVSLAEDFPITLWFWDSDTGDVLHAITQTYTDIETYSEATIEHLLMNSDGRMIVSAQTDGEIIIWGVLAGDE